MRLKEEIEARFVTIHRFCRLHPQLPRSVVYRVVKGTYEGNAEAQTKRIRDALDGVDDEAKVFEMIKDRVCAKCNVNGACTRCDGTFRTAAKAAAEYFSF